MKLLSVRKTGTAMAAVIGIAMGHVNTFGQANTGTNENFSAVGEAVVKWLETGDAPALAKALSPTVEDWHAAESGDRVSQKSVETARAKLERNARELLARARELKVDFSKVRLTGEVKSRQPATTIRYGEGLPVPYTQELEVTVSARPAAADTAASRLSGRYQLKLRGLVRFQGGWRCVDGILWTSFPSGVADETVQRELAILAKAGGYQGITQAEEPALGKLAETLGRFIRERDLGIFENEALMSFDSFWASLKKQLARSGQKMPPRAEAEQDWRSQKDDLVKPARAVLAVLEQGGVDLKTASIKVVAAEFESLYPRGGASTLEGLEGNHLRIAFQIESEANARTGKSLSGTYLLGAEEAVRSGGRWYISENLHWKRFPDGVLDEKAVDAVAVENYVADHNTLPPGTAAPDIEFVRMAGKEKLKLSDFRGKVIVLDFWATDCGPCQEPLKELQTLRAGNPQWSNRVELVTLSIDDTQKRARDHLEKRGWTNTFNVWAGPGGWKAGPTQKFRVTSIPTTYVIDPEGKIIVAGHPVGLEIPGHVDELLSADVPKR